MNARIQQFRAIVLVGALMVFGLGQQWTMAETQSQAPISIEVVDAGSLEIGWSTESSQFLVNGSQPELSATTPQVVATADYVLRIRDTRTDDSRTGYAIRLSSSDFVAVEGSADIPAANLSIINVTGLPEGLSSSSAIGQTLDGAPTLLVVPDGSAAVSADLVITVAMTITAETRVAEYTGALTYTLVPSLGP